MPKGRLSAALRSGSDTHNGLNQVTATGAASVSHDARGNISAIGSDSYGYSSENLLTSGPSSVTLAYDPMLRLYQTSGGATTRFAYDGLALIAEHDGSNTLLRRYVHGSGMDEPLVQYEGTGTSDRRFLHADERGSVVALTDSAGALIGNLNLYDEYGAPQGTMNGRFGYTGQTWLPELNLWYYKARMYAPNLGRFMQTDPIGYGAGMNLYGYVSGDPVNFYDPSGTNCRTIELNVWNVTGGDQTETWTQSGPVHTRYSYCTGSSPTQFTDFGNGAGGGSDSTQCDSSIAYLISPGINATAAVSQQQADTARRNPNPSFFGRILSGIGLIFSLGGSTPRPVQYRHYGYSADSALFINGLRAGSFATTSAGAALTGQQAQAILALPNRPGRGVPDAYYTVTVSVNTPVIGPNTVRPANGQPGGGVEYMFPNGTPPGSVGQPNPIPSC